MPRDRTISGFGPTKITFTHSSTLTTGTPWVPFGPFDAGKFYAACQFAIATAGTNLRIQGNISTACSTVTAKTLIYQIGTDNNAYVKSTYTSGVFSVVRCFSTMLANAATSGVTMLKTAYFNALP